MSNFFDYNFNVVDETQLPGNNSGSTSSGSGVASATSSVKYAPSSFFYTDFSKIKDAASPNIVTDAFGPVLGAETTKYRTTSFVRSLAPADIVKVFAIADGQILIQPQTGDDTKINIIIKNANSSYSPLKIKYFIYRGITKSDFFTGLALNAPDATNLNQPAILQKMWAVFMALNSLPSISGVIFPVEYIFETSIPNETLLDEAFRSSLISCKAGDHIGNFSGAMGLDIVLDYGDYQLENQEVLFNLNLGYARANEFVFDTSTIIPSTPIKIKRYKEHIHQFIDAAAFWGSHIKNGKIFIEKSVFFSKIDDVYNNILVKYATKNRVYVYIRNEKNKSFNYYTNKEISGFESDETPARNYSTYGWPILYNKTGLSTTGIPSDGILDEDMDASYPKSGLKLELQCDVGNNQQGIDSNKDFKNTIIEKEQYLSIYSFDTNENSKLNSYSFEKIDTNAITNIFTFDYYVKYYINNNEVCSIFLMLSTNLEQNFPLDKYFNNLWIPNIISTLPINEIYKATYNRDLNINVIEVLKTGAIIQQDVIFDTGKSLTGTVGQKKRRLYITSFKRNFIESDYKYRNLNVDKSLSASSENMTSLENYVNFVYGSKDFSIYRGKFLDGSQSIYSLSLLNKNDHWLKNSYFHIGITEDDYRNLFFLNNVQQIPNDSDNLFFYLDEDINFANDSVRKFNLGIKYENNLEQIVTFFPTIPINIYTLDGMYFFSKDYSDYQEFYEELSSNALVHFRPMPDWNGEFGFDWLRIGDSNTTGDTNGSGGKPDRRYKSVIGNYYKTITSEEKKPYKYGSTNPSVFRKEKKEYQSFSNYNYYMYPTNTDTYCTSWISLFPEKNELSMLSGYPKNLLGYQSCLIEAKINLKIKITGTITKLRLQFQKDFIEIISTNPAEFSNPYSDSHYTYLDIKQIGITTLTSITVTIKCIKECRENSKIKILATENGIEKLAGESIMYANSKSQRKSIDMAFINCKTNLNGVDKQFNFLNISNNLFIKYLYRLERLVNQSLIELNLKTIIDFDLTPTSTAYSNFNSDWTKTEIDGTVVIDFDKKNTIGGKDCYLPEYMRRKVRNTLGIATLPAEYFIVTTIEEYADLGGGEIYGSAELNQKRLSLTLFQQGFYDISDVNKPTFVFGHEFYHTLDCDHSFSYDFKNLFMFEFSKTDNLMDYPHLNTDKIDSTGIWWFQRQIARKNINGLLKNLR